MQNFNAPTGEDLHTYRVLINFLQQSRSLLEDINEETERSIQLLKEQKAMLEEQDCALQDLSSNLKDYEQDAEDLFDGLRDKEELLTSVIKVNNENVTAMTAYRSSQREEAKFEQAAEAAEAFNG